MEQQLIVIGKIVAPHGVRGDVRVVPLTDYPERFERLASVLLEDGKPLNIAEVKYHKQFVLLKFAGFEDRTAVERLQGKLLHVRRADVLPLPEGRYYIFDIVGLSVYDEAGEYLGKVTEVLETGSNDVYVTEREGQKPILIPALKSVVLEVDIPGSRMIVKLQEEWE